jgi:beta-glucanase (GH16 family)
MTPKSGTILFEDDFNGPAGSPPDSSKWIEWSSATYEGSAAYGYIKPGMRSTLDGDGHLIIPATPTQGTSISTADSFKFVYGTMTARMFLPTDGGYWPAFWSLNNYPHPGTMGGDAPVVGEIDVLEGYTSLANGYRDAIHNWSGSTSWSGGDDQLLGLGHTLGEWHDYGARVEPGKITMLRDGVQVGAIATKEQGAGKPYAFGPDILRGNWLILTMAIGGASGQQDGLAVAPSQLLVDRVEVRAL